MRRRALPALLAVLVALSGCTALLPASHPPAGLAEEPPRVLCDATWTDGEVTITVAAGHAVTADWALNLSVAGTAEGTTLWASTVAPGAARDSYPVEPGDSLTVPVEADRDRVRVTVASPRTATTLCTLYRGGGG
jgi:hypothetical protein